jgi:hypothetical protein
LKVILHRFTDLSIPHSRPPWQLNALNLDNENRPFVVSQQYERSLHEKAELRRVLEGWRGR